MQLQYALDVVNVGFVFRFSHHHKPPLQIFYLALEFEKLRNNILNNPMYKGSIVSEDETASLIVFNIENEANVNLIAKEVIEKTTRYYLWYQ